MDHDHDPTSEPRRAFLRRIGTTFAAGIGLAAFGGTVAGARPAGIQPCTLYCRATACPGNCYPYNEFLCKNACDGSEYTTCLNRSCGPHCLDTVCV